MRETVKVATPEREWAPGSTFVRYEQNCVPNSTPIERPDGWELTRIWHMVVQPARSRRRWERVTKNWQWW